MNTIQRTNILSRIQKALREKIATETISEAFQRLTAEELIPVQPQLSSNLEKDFTRAASDSAAQVHRINSLADLPAWIAEHAAQLDTQPPLAVAPELAARFQFPDFDQVEDCIAPNTWGLTLAHSGIAETGTIVSVSRDCPSGLLFLAERLIIVLDRETIVAYQEDVWELLRQRFGGRMPRTVNLITGPSRTADVEQEIQIGAHGPKWVDYVIFG